MIQPKEAGQLITAELLDELHMVCNALLGRILLEPDCIGWIKTTTSHHGLNGHTVSVKLGNGLKQGVRPLALHQQARKTHPQSPRAMVPWPRWQRSPRGSKAHQLHPGTGVDHRGISNRQPGHHKIGAHSAAG